MSTSYRELPSAVMVWEPLCVPVATRIVTVEDPSHKCVAISVAVIWEASCAPVATAAAVR